MSCRPDARSGAVAPVEAAGSDVSTCANAGAVDKPTTQTAASARIREEVQVLLLRRFMDCPVLSE